MASSINASTASGGGIITSADASGILQLQTAGTTAVTIDASQNVALAGTLTGVGSGLTGTASGLTAGNATTAAACSGNSATATQLSTASGSAPSYSARAWVNFNGTGTVAIRASGNVSSITDSGVGIYVVNFTTAMSDNNHAVFGFAIHQEGVSGDTTIAGGGQDSSSVAVLCLRANDGVYYDPSIVGVSTFR